MKIKKINYGIGYTVCSGNRPLYIELNRNLDKYPKLKKQVLAHELLHWKSRSLINDFKIDFFDIFNFKKQREISKFIRENPRANLCNSPFLIEDGKLIPNYFLITVYSIALISLVTMGVILI